jgi:hypothetical protein
MKKKILIVFFLIGILGILFRFYYINQYPLLHDSDPWIYARETQEILSKGKVLSVESWSYPEIVQSKPRLYIVLLSVETIITHLDIIFLIKYFILFINLLIILFIYLNSKKLFNNNKLIPIFALIFYSFTPQFILRTSLTLPENITLLFFMICLFFLLKNKSTKNRISLYLSLFFSIISISFHLGGVFILGFFIIYFLLNYKSIKHKKVLLILSFFLGLSLFFSYPLLIGVIKYHLFHYSNANNVFTPDIDPPLTFAYYIQNIGIHSITLLFIGLFLLIKNLNKEKKNLFLIIYSLLLIIYFDLYPRFRNFLSINISVLPARILTYFLIIFGIFVFGFAYKYVIMKTYSNLLKYLIVGISLILIINPLVWFWQKDISNEDYEGILWIKNNTFADSFIITQPLMRSQSAYLLNRKIILSTENFHFSKFLLENPSLLSEEINSLNLKKEIYVLLFKKKINSFSGVNYYDEGNLAGTNLSKINGSIYFKKVYENPSLLLLRWNHNP